MIPTPIRQVLSTMQANGIRALLMGGQACVFYGAAQVSKDVDLLVLADGENFARLARALKDLDAHRIAVPRFDTGLLERGHAIHYRCKAPGVEGLRIDIMSKLRDLPDFECLWERRTVIEDEGRVTFNLMAVPDLVQAKKTQRSKDWPIIEALVSIHYAENADAPTGAFIDFWLKEARTPEMLLDLLERFPADYTRVEQERTCLSIARSGDLDALREVLDREIREEQAKDRRYWDPLKREIEAFRHDSDHL